MTYDLQTSMEQKPVNDLLLCIVVLILCLINMYIFIILFYCMKRALANTACSVNKALYIFCIDI